MGLSHVDTGQLTYQLGATLIRLCPCGCSVTTSGSQPKPLCSATALPCNLPPVLRPELALQDPDHATLFPGHQFPNTCLKTGFGASPEVRSCSLSASCVALGKFPNLSETHCPSIRCRREIATLQGSTPCTVIITFTICKMGIKIRNSHDGWRSKWSQAYEMPGTGPGTRGVQIILTLAFPPNCLSKNPFSVERGERKKGLLEGMRRRGVCYLVT